nr:hypothetical protein [Tanacetum cinerariifolium]
MTKTEIRRHELECKKKLQENTSYGDLLKSVRTDALSFGESILNEVAEEPKKEAVKDTKEDAVATIKKYAGSNNNNNSEGNNNN